MHHVHFDKCSSTQNYLKDNVKRLLEIDKYILISTGLQTNGVGRSGNRWDHFQNGLAFSFTIQTEEIVTLIPLLIGVAISSIIKELYQIDLFLKWPNDIVNSSSNKCGGIICNYHTRDTVLVGVGLNLGEGINASESYKFEADYIKKDLVLNCLDKRNLPKVFYEKILNFLALENDLSEIWSASCIHINKLVELDLDGGVITGRFIGIGDSGEAIIETSSGVKKIVSGSLNYD